ncbi:RNA polymerase factor sigma-54 [Bacteroidales bacterium Barb7]|nr:RNA polymerase factor sigma-54 [Bacteroidales bacterium Barb7]
MLKQQLQQKLQQKLSPQHVQYIRLLEFPALEFEERIKRELEENPALEEGADTSKDLDEDGGDDDNIGDDSLSPDAAEDLSLGDYLSEDDIPDYKLREISERPAQKEDIPFSIGQSLHEYLLQQLGLRDLSESQFKTGEYLIGNIEDDGYLRRRLSAIAEDLSLQGGETSKAELQTVLNIIKDFEPTGVGAYNLQECLLLQLGKKESTPAVRLAVRILTDFFDEFTYKHYDNLLQNLPTDSEMLRKAVREITSLNPKPGNDWGSSLDSAMNLVTPDFIVESHNGELTLSMNKRGIPSMHINTDYATLFQDYLANKTNRTPEMRQAVLFIKQKLDSAQGFIDAVRQRQETLQRTMQAIVLLQHEFFLTGDETTLRPMILKDIAEHSGYDISTISRVSNSKYVQTSFGVYPLKYFFTESMQTDSGEEISNREVKKIVKEHIEGENKRKPLTDDMLAAILKREGYIVARRTVAKYREQLNIPIARLRKEI